MPGVFDKDNYRWYAHKKQPLKLIKSFFFDMKCRRQRIKRGWCEKDAWDISGWFLDVMPAMLTHLKENRNGSPGVLGENYTNADGVMVNDACHAEWDAILEKMIFLFREANEQTCTKKNPYAEAHMAVYEEFTKKYGLLGEKLNPPDADASKGTQAHFASEIPEYADTETKYQEEDRRIDEYRDSCKDEALDMFKKWFWHLWD